MSVGSYTPRYQLIPVKRDGAFLPYSQEKMDGRTTLDPPPMIEDDTDEYSTGEESSDE